MNSERLRSFIDLIVNDGIEKAALWVAFFCALGWEVGVLCCGA